MSAPESSGRLALALTLLAFAVHLVWGSTLPVPGDWDALYYREIARNLAAGRGPVLDGLWHLALLPPSLPAVADDYWMPLPSRVFVPGTWLAGDLGARITGAALAAAWVPIGMALARSLSLPARGVALAGWLCCLPGIYLRLVSTTDVYALFGLLGGLGLLGAARGTASLAIGAGVLAALTRNDGFLLAPCLALAFRGRERVGVALAGPLAAAGWLAWSLQVHGPEVARARGLVTRSGDYLALYEGTVTHALGAWERLAGALAAMPSVVDAWLAPLLVLGGLLAMLGAWRHWDAPWVRAGVAFAVVQPLVAIALTPSVANHGTLLRSATATITAQAALAAAGTLWAAERGQALRGYAPTFTIGLVAVTLGLGANARAWAKWREMSPPMDCAVLAPVPEGAVVFASAPLEVLGHCDRSAVAITRTLDPARAAEVAERYDIRWVLLAPAGRQDEGSLGPEDAPAVLPGWEPVTERIWRRRGERSRSDPP